MLVPRDFPTYQQSDNDNQRKNIKFKTLKPELLPYINHNKSRLQFNLDKFTKNSFQNRWRSQAYLKQNQALKRVNYNQSKSSQIQRIKSQLRNEKFFLKMHRNDLSKRLDSHLLIRAAMKEVANNQQNQLGRNNSQFL